MANTANDSTINVDSRLGSSKQSPFVTCCHIRAPSVFSNSILSVALKSSMVFLLCSTPCEYRMPGLLRPSEPLFDTKFHTKLICLRKLASRTLTYWMKCNPIRGHFAQHSNCWRSRVMFGVPYWADQHSASVRLACARRMPARTKRTVRIGTVWHLRCWTCCDLFDMECVAGWRMKMGNGWLAGLWMGWMIFQQ